MEGAFFRTKKDIIRSKLNFLDNKIKELDAALLFVSFVLFTLFAFYINKNIPIKALYMDDLYAWSWYAELDITKYLTSGITNWYRPIAWFVSYIEFALVGNNPFGFSILNIVFNSFIALFIYYFARKLCNNFFLSFAAGILYLASHFSYYQICQVVGIYESLTMLFSLLFLFFTLKYYNCDIKEKSNAYFCIIIIIYIIASFTNERTIALIPVFLVALFLKNKVRISSKFIKTIMCIVTVFAVLAIRSYFTGSLLPSFTNTSKIFDTFSVEKTASSILLQALHILGFSYGENNIVGITFNSLDEFAKGFVIINVLLISIIELLYLMVALSHSYKTSIDDIDKPFPRVGMDLILLTFIVVNIAVVSLALRLELRHIYISMAGFILFAVFKISEISRLINKVSVKRIMFIIFILWAVTRLFVDMSYRKGSNEVYFVKDQLKVNSLAKETIYKHGFEKINNSDVYIIDSNFKLSDFYATWFFRVFAPNKTDKVTKIEQIYSADLSKKKIKDGSIVLKDKDSFTYEPFN